MRYRRLAVLIAAFALGATGLPAGPGSSWLLGEETPKTETSTSKVFTLESPRTRRPGRPPAPLPAYDAPGEGLDLLADVEVQVPGKPVMAERYLRRARQLVAYGQPREAITALRLAYQWGYDRAEVDGLLARTSLMEELPRQGLFHGQRAVHGDRVDPRQIYVTIGQLHGLAGEAVREIASYERALTLDPDYGEAHFMLALAYDKVDNSPKVLEHAQKAIRIDPEYKEKLKPRIKDSNVSKKVGRLVTRVLRDSKYERLTDEKIEGYAQEIGKILGSTPRKPRAVPQDNRERIRRVLRDIRSGRTAREALNRHMPREEHVPARSPFVER